MFQLTRKQARVAFNMSQRRLQVVRHGITEGLQLLDRLPQFHRPRLDALLQRRIQTKHFLFRHATLGNVRKRGHHGVRESVVVAQHRKDACVGPEFAAVFPNDTQWRIRRRSPSRRVDRT